MKKIKISLSIIFLFFIKTSSVFAISSEVHQVNSKASNLYLQNINQIKQVQTVTYFFTNQNISNETKNMFKLFAYGIGATHSAVVINKKELEYYFDFSKKMKYSYCFLKFYFV